MGSSVQHAPASVEEVLCTSQLSSRPARAPRAIEEAAAFSRLARQLALQPQSMLQVLVDEALVLCDAGSAGVSLLEPQADGAVLFRWVALAGQAAAYVGGSTPRDFSPCGVCLDRNQAILLAQPARCFTYFQEVPFEIVEGLVIPLRTEEEVFGTIWIMSHDPNRHFDSEDSRVMTGLADFTAAALRLMKSSKDLAATGKRQAVALELLERQRRTDDPKAIMQAASEAVGRHLNVDRVGFFEMEGDNLHFLVGWSDGRLPLLEQDIPAAWIGTRYLQEVLTGRTLGISDARANPLTQDSRFGDIGTVSLIGVPIIRHGRWHAGFYVNHSEPRLWSAEDVALVHDIGEQTWDAVERARATAAVRKSEERLTLALEAGDGVGTFDWDVREDRVYSNKRLAEIYCVDAERAKAGVPMAELAAAVHPDDKERIRKARDHAMSTNTDYTEEYRLIQPDGSVRWINARGRGHGNEAGTPLRFSGVAFDITHKKKAEEDLRASEALARSILDSSPDCVKLLDLEGRVRFMNEPGMKLLGICDITPHLGQSWVGFWKDPEHSAAAERAVALALAGGVGEMEGHFDTFDGRSTWWEVRLTAIPDRSGRPVQLLALSRDVTGRRLAQQEREQLMAELERSNHELSQFSHMVAHDLQSPVRTIRTFVEILARKHSGDGDDELNTIILTAADRMQQLIRSLLEYAAVGHGELHRSSVPAAEVVQTVQESMTTALQEAGARIHSGPLPVVPADRSQLEQLFQNLLGNAIKYRRVDTNPVIHISAKTVEGGWRFAVRDNCQGIESRFAQTIFQPLKRLHGDEIPGTGLGLALCTAIVERHGGRIWVESTPGVGSTFFFTLSAAAD